MGTYHKVAETKDLEPGCGMLVRVGEHQIALFNVNGTYYAIGDSCTHRGGPLSEGTLEGTTVTCPLHGANFDVCTGKNLTPPAPQPVPSHPVRIQGDEIQVELP